MADLVLDKLMQRLKRLATGESCEVLGSELPLKQEHLAYWCRALGITIEELPASDKVRFTKLNPFGANGRLLPPQPFTMRR